ncbi:MAG: molybdenum cofactor guanylyltransferase MobA [Burkholderiaceae bacterium]|nr:molybdenum cofactor guanylyltransferase MobA [Burkholderiaceae bacterium]
MTADRVTGLILAGGRGSRMGGTDKGLQPLRGMPMAMHVLWRLAPQVTDVVINANRNLGAYEGFGRTVVPDASADFQGPLAGMLAGLPYCETEWMMVVPCDTPHLPTDLVARLLEAAEHADAPVAMPVTVEADGRRQTHPVFLLVRGDLYDSLSVFMQNGGRKIDAWTGSIGAIEVPFDDPAAFFNANTLAELNQLEQVG